MAPGYAGTTGTNDGNADIMFSDDDVHPSNLGSRFLGNIIASAIKTGVLAL
jgi:lysophospholipase L1-like esterase